MEAVKKPAIHLPRVFSMIALCGAKKGLLGDVVTVTCKRCIKKFEGQRR